MLWVGVKWGGEREGGGKEERMAESEVCATGVRWGGELGEERGAGRGGRGR